MSLRILPGPIAKHPLPFLFVFIFLLMAEVLGKLTYLRLQKMWGSKESSSQEPACPTTETHSLGGGLDWPFLSLFAATLSVLPVALAHFPRQEFWACLPYSNLHVVAWGTEEDYFSRNNSLRRHALLACPFVLLLLTDVSAYPLPIR